MPQKRNHDFTERYPNKKAGTYEPMCNKDIISTYNLLFAVRQRFRIMSKTHNDLKFGKEMKMLMVVDSSLLPLIFLAMYSSKLNEFQINIVFKEDVLIQRMCY